MTSFSAELIGIDAPPLELARTWTAERARRTLESLDAAARSIGAEETWSRAALLGTDVGVGATFQAHGISMSRACFPGVGFTHEDDLRLRFPSSLDLVWGPERPRPEAAVKARERLRPILEAHLEEFSAVMNVAHVAREELSLPVCAQVDIVADDAYEFHEAYRRRVAYAFGFAASLDAGSLEPYRAREQPLLHGSFDELVAACREPTGFPGLSICANLLVRLGGVLTCQGSHEPDTSRLLSLRVPDAPRKQQWLEERRREVEDALRADLNEDGRAALDGLAREIERERQQLHYGYGGYPSWGKAGTREDFGLSE